jgi:hypothetical protein
MGMISHQVTKTIAIAVIGAAIVLASFEAVAQSAASMSCGELWYARNAIYARNGYCFETPRGRATFGPGCFPPYGQLRGYDRSRVNELQSWERQRGC